MPQMNPMMWSTLFFLFIITLLMVNCINYFNKSYLFNKQNLNSTFKEINWKW